MYSEIDVRAGSVLILVYIEMASLVKRRALCGNCRFSREWRRVYESWKKDGWAWAMGCSCWSTHLPSLCGRLVTLEQTGHVGKCPFIMGL